jgi:hypothetical protein
VTHRRWSQDAERTILEEAEKALADGPLVDG